MGLSAVSYCVDEARLLVCRHCGEVCDANVISTDHGEFCCRGCASVFAILTAHRLDGFYADGEPAGVCQRALGDRDPGRFAILDDPAVAARLIDADTGRLARATLSVPAMHCASCVWLLEQLWRFDPGVVRADADLLRRTVRIEFQPQVTSLRRVVEQLAALGYEPALTPDATHGMARSTTRRLYLQLGVAGFAFGNIMLFSVPHYANGGPIEDGFQRLFDGLNVAFALPVLLFSASDYFRTALRAVRTRTMAVEVPVALGLAVLFGRSLVDIASGRGAGFMDSFAGLVFFLLIGRLFQQKVFDRVAFDRTFRSFLPLSVQVEQDTDGLAAVSIDRLQIGDRVVMRRHEVVPADAVLLDDATRVDYAFVTGEQTPVLVLAGETVRAGGRVLDRAVRLRLLEEVSQSQLARFWSEQVDGRAKEYWLTAVASRFGKWFTVAAVGIAAAGAAAWWPDVAASMTVATAVLIVACPCAITLSAPITLGTAMGLLGTRGLYLKHPAIALDLSRVDTVAFDKTGTLTTAGEQTTVEHEGLDDLALSRVRRLAAESIHPTSRAIAAAALSRSDAPAAGRPRLVCEVAGEGICGSVDGIRVAIGTAAFIQARTGISCSAPDDATRVVVGERCGWVRVAVAARPGIERAVTALGADHLLCLLSGDHGGGSDRWSRVFGHRMHFRQSPQDKLAFIAGARAQGRRVLMVGDGLNDAGALAAADVGMAVTDETACLAPSCDAVISGRRLASLPAFLAYTRRARQVIIACFIVSILYNVIGLGLALVGALTPLVAAIFMPVSSLTIVGMSAGLMRWSARRMLPV